jgi:hypothetical protein
LAEKITPMGAIKQPTAVTTFSFLQVSFNLIFSSYNARSYLVLIYQSWKIWQCRSNFLVLLSAGANFSLIH